MRRVDLETNIIETVVGRTNDNDHVGWKPNFSSTWQVLGKDYTLQWPTDLKISPVDERLTILDEGFLYKLSDDGMLYQFPWYRCDKNLKEDCHKLAEYPRSITYSTAGSLFVGTLSNGTTSSSVWRIDPQGRIQKFADSSAELGWISDILAEDNDSLLIW